MKKSRKIINKVAAITVAFAVAFTMIPFAAGDLDAHAASYWKGLKANATSRTSASISWTQLTKKQRKKISGITVYRNGKAVKNIGKTAKSFSESGLKAGTTYSYQLKTYKASKQKQWFNKKTGTWQKKKPKKKWRGKSRKITVYKYANTSTAMKITTPKPVAPVKYTITWKNWDGSVLKTEILEKGVTPKYTGSNPEKPADNDYAYTFTGWTPTIKAVSADISYTAQFSASPIHTVTWVNYDNSVLATNVFKEGEMPVYSGPTPTRPDVVIDSNNPMIVKRYTFSGKWKNVQANTVGLTAVTEDTTYRAQYTVSTVDISPKDYTITWKNWDGSVLATDTVTEGNMPSYTGETPTRPSDNNSSYSFTGWTPEVSVVTGDAEYTAQYAAAQFTDADTYIDYNGIHIQINQAWSSSLESQLASASNGTWSCVRPQGYLTDSGDYKAITTIMYNINTYEAFMALYVVDGQVGGWATNSDPFFVCQGVSLARGQSKDTYPQRCNKFSAGNLGCLVMGVGLNGTYRGGSDADERTIGFHFINAARVAAGRSPLRRNKHLEGVDLSSGANMTWSGTIPEGYPGKGNTLTEQRYGAQAWAETLGTSRPSSGFHQNLPSGPLGMDSCPIEGLSASEWSDPSVGIRGKLPWFASNKTIRIDGENCGMGTGENCIYVYSDSTLHLGPMLSSSMKSVGVGYNSGYHCEQYSENKE